MGLGLEHIIPLVVAVHHHHHLEQLLDLQALEEIRLLVQEHTAPPPRVAVLHLFRLVVALALCGLGPNLPLVRVSTTQSIHGREGRLLWALLKDFRK